MKVIFLDIDGVLNVYCEGRDKYGCLFHKHFEDNLRCVIEETGAKIVISSTWRMSGLKVMQAMWEYRGLAGEVIGVTPMCADLDDDLAFSERCERGNEIKEWIDGCGFDIESYVIIDDDNDMLPEQQSVFVRTSDNVEHEDCVDVGYGLTKTCAELAIGILNGSVRRLEK